MKNKVASSRISVDCAILAIRAFQADCGRYPTTEEGLTALIERPPAIAETQWRGPYVVNWWKKIPSDPWHRWYIYKYPGQHNTNGFDISSSAGMDHPGIGEEIGNW
jgi:general secretion pathway protein G